MRVTIIQRVLPHYRLPFYELLKANLAKRGIDLRLLYGQEYPGTVPRTVDLGMDWACRITNRYLSCGGARLVWQPVLRYLHDSDLTIVEQANALLINYLLQLRRVFGGPRIAYWGHGCNMQAANRDSVAERVKRSLTGQVDWWFAYTDLSARLVEAAGFPTQKITVVQNTIDTSALMRTISRLDGGQTKALKNELGIHGESVLLYCGGMYRDKNLDFLLQACIGIKRYIADLHVIFIGDGPEQSKVEKAAAEHAWLHYVGPRFGADRAPYFKLSKGLLMPGLVGLAIVDAFAAGVPLFTTDIPGHGPEIAYLADGVNGFMTIHQVAAYAACVTDYLRSQAKQARVEQACLASARKYSLTNMAENFTRGIAACLAEPGYKDTVRKRV